MSRGEVHDDLLEPAAPEAARSLNVDPRARGDGRGADRQPRSGHRRRNGWPGFSRVQTSPPSAPRATPTWRRPSSSAAGSTTRRSTGGWWRDTTLAGDPSSACRSGPL